MNVEVIGTVLNRAPVGHRSAYHYSQQSYPRAATRLTRLLPWRRSATESVGGAQASVNDPSLEAKRTGAE